MKTLYEMYGEQIRKEEEIETGEKQIHFKKRRNFFIEEVKGFLEENFPVLLSATSVTISILIMFAVLIFLNKK